MKKETAIGTIVALIVLIGIGIFFYANRHNNTTTQPPQQSQTTGNGQQTNTGGVTPTQTAPTQTTTGSPAPTTTPPPVNAAGAISQEFFGMGTLKATDWPPMTIGMLGHPTFVWASVEHSRGVYNWTGMDTYVNAAKSHGLVDSNGAVLISMTLGLTPGWAVANQSSCSEKYGTRVQCTAPPDNIQDWKDFITALITHFNGVTAPHVKYYELWNEVTAGNFWTGTTPQLVSLAQAAYPIIHQDPYSQLLTPSSPGPVGTNEPYDGSYFMKQYLQDGGAQYSDGLAFHGYEGPITESPFPWPENSNVSACGKGSPGNNGCYSGIVDKVTTYRSIMDADGMAGKPIIQTEGSWGKDTITDPDQQVAWLSRWLILQAGLSKPDNLISTIWYTWGSAGGDTYGSIENSNLTPTSAGVAYGQVENWLLGANISPCTNSGSIWTCGVSRSGGYQAEIMWDVSQSCQSGKCTALTQSVNSEFTKYRDLSGNSTAINGSAQVGMKPIILENK